MVEQDRRRGRRRLLAAAGILMVVAGLALLAFDPFGSDGPEVADVPEAGSRFGAQDDGREQSLLDALAPVLGTESSSVELPVEQAVAQLFAVGFEGERPPPALERRMRTRAWGVVLVGATNLRSPSQLRDVAGTLERSARRGRQTPPIVAADPDALGRLGPPPAPDIGAEGTAREARVEALAAARRLREAHVRMILGPSADLAVAGGPAQDRGFTDDPLLAARFLEAAVAGWKEARMVVAPGRFPGEGAASQDPLVGPATVGLSTDELSQRDVEPFRSAVRAGADAIQMSAALYAAWDGVTPATLLPEAVRFLRVATGFDGAVVSADLIAATAVSGGGVGRAAVEALRAGCDLLVIAGGREDQEAAYRAVLGAVRREEIPRSRLAEAVRRVQALKKAAEAPGE